MKQCLNRFFSFFLLMLTLLLSGCHTAPITFSEAAQQVPFRELNNYFVRKNGSTLEYSSVITSQEEFDARFGMAAFMGPNGRPTAVDFKHEVVLAVVMPALEQTCTLRVKEVVKEKDRLVFRYIQTLGEPLTYTIRPCLLIAIEKSELASNLLFSPIEEEIVP
jgi:hypothetical protein